MLLPGTQMHLVTFLFVCIEIVILFYLIIYRFARPDDKTTSLNIVLITLLIFYNVTGGLLPDDNLPGSNFTQNALAYATGFITPCYFPYYVYKAFGLEKMRFHAFKGVFACILLPYIIFLVVFGDTGSLSKAKDILIVPLLYAIWVIVSLQKAVRYKYQNDFTTMQSRQERAVLLVSLTPWVGVPIIDFFNLGQAIEATVTNVGFLTLFAYQVKEHVKGIRLAHERLEASERELIDWNKTLQSEVEKRTSELALANEQQMNTFINLTHETKTPLTLVNNYMAEYIQKHGSTDELRIIKQNLDKLSADIINLFDLEKFKKGFIVYDADRISNFSEILRERLLLFKSYGEKKGVNVESELADDLYVKADPPAINRIINNLIENAIKYSFEDEEVLIKLYCKDGNVIFSVQDYGPGIPQQMQAKVFEPYFQIKSKKSNADGMGLGLPITKNVVEQYGGTIKISSEPDERPGTVVEVSIPECLSPAPELYLPDKPTPETLASPNDTNVANADPLAKNKTILVVEDNVTMLDFLVKKLGEEYTIYSATNGQKALQKLQGLADLPNLILTDVMMDETDGYRFAQTVSDDPAYQHIPIVFLSAKSTPEDKIQGLKAGAVDFVSKPFNIDELLHKIGAIIAQAEKQQTAVLNSVLSGVQNSLTQQPATAEEGQETDFDGFSLSLRERDIARLVCEGMQYAAIGERLFISERTVSKHVQNIFKKVKVSNRVELTKKLHC